MLTPATLWSVSTNVHTGIEMPRVNSRQAGAWVLVAVCKDHVCKASFHPSPTQLVTMSICHLILSHAGFSADLQKQYKKGF